MDYLLSRHPIYGSKINVAGYEIRSRVIDDDETSLARNRTPYSKLTQEGLAQIAGNHLCYINLTEEALSAGWWKTVPIARSVLCYYENFAPNSTVADELVRLAQEGARVALSSHLDPCSLDLFGGRIYAMKFNVTEYAPDDLADVSKGAQKRQTQLLATGVDTYDDLEYCKELDFDLYQGHFISRAALKQEQDKDIPVNRLTMMRVLSKLQDPSISMPELERAVSLDAALSYKLLTYANSAAIALPRKVSSIGHAVRMVGIDMLRSWASVLLLSSVDDKPRELLTMALVRARMCELLSASVKNAQKDSFFSTGLLSVIDALLDCPMEKALEKLPLVDEVKAALVQRIGPAGQALRCAVAYERAEWDDVQFYGVGQGAIRDAYMESITWARKLSAGLLT